MLSLRHLRLGRGGGGVGSGSGSGSCWRRARCARSWRKSAGSNWSLGGAGGGGGPEASSSRGSMPLRSSWAQSSANAGDGVGRRSGMGESSHRRATLSGGVVRGWLRWLGRVAELAVPSAGCRRRGGVPVGRREPNRRAYLTAATTTAAIATRTLAPAISAEIRAQRSCVLATRYWNPILVASSSCSRPAGTPRV